MRTKLLLSAAILTLAATLLAETKVPRLLKVYVGSDGLAHVVDIKGNDLAIPNEKDQAGVSAPKLSPDKQTAGWLIQRESCCTSYTLPTSLALYRGGKTRTLGDGLVIFDWCFVGEGTQVALSTGTVHGMDSRHLILYDVRSGRMLSEWNGDLAASPPLWAKDLL